MKQTVSLFIIMALLPFMGTLACSNSTAKDDTRQATADSIAKAVNDSLYEDLNHTFQELVENGEGGTEKFDSIMYAKENAISYATLCRKYEQYYDDESTIATGSGQGLHMLQMYLGGIPYEKVRELISDRCKFESENIRQSHLLALELYRILDESDSNEDKIAAYKAYEDNLMQVRDEMTKNDPQEWENEMISLLILNFSIPAEEVVEKAKELGMFKKPIPGLPEGMFPLRAEEIESSRENLLDVERYEGRKFYFRPE